MSSHQLHDDTKGLLRRTITRLRERLLADIRAEAERIYRLGIPVADAGLRAGLRADREALESILARRGAAPERVSRERAITEMVAEAASTLLHRIVLIRHMEALEVFAGPDKGRRILPLPLLTGGARSLVYLDASIFLPELVGRPDDASKGFAHLLPMLYEELAHDLPGLFGEVGTTRLFPVPGATLLTVIEDLDDPKLASAWADDTTTGWVYQFWNDAEKARIDKKIDEGEGEGTGKGKVEAHEIAPKTALYTERYMVEWLLQNSLGPMWRAICRKHGRACEADDVLPKLAAMRAAEKVEIADDAEDRWKYHVDVPLSDAFIEAAPDSIRDLRLLDPACGSGHFLVAAFDWLFAAWTEEARLRGEAATGAEIAAGIVENNLHGIDIDPAAVQLAAAAVYLKARQHGGHPRRVNLVAAHFGLKFTSKEDIKAFAAKIGEATAVDPLVVETLLTGLTKADTLGSLTRVEALDEKLLPLLSWMPLTAAASRVGAVDRPDSRKADAREQVVAMIAGKLARLTRTDDLGVRLGAEQLAAGLRFTGMLAAGSYDVVVANPPYLTTQKLDPAVAPWFSTADLYEAFLLRGCELARVGGRVAYVTLRGWMFLEQGSSLRRVLRKSHHIRVLADLHFGAFREEKDVSVSMVVVEPGQTANDLCAFVRAVADLGDVVRDLGQPGRNEAGLARQPGRWDAAVSRFDEIIGCPLVYWWSDQFLERYLSAPKLGDHSTVTAGAQAAPLERFVCSWWEVPRAAVYVRQSSGEPAGGHVGFEFSPYIGGGEDRTWFEPVTEILRWGRNGLCLKVWQEFRFGSASKRVAGESWYFHRGVTFTKIGSRFRARASRFESVFGDAGQSAFTKDWLASLAMMNSDVAREILCSFNPTVNFQVGDVKRLAVLPVADSTAIVSTLELAFSAHESRREASIEFAAPGASAWESAQEWADIAVNRRDGAPLPPYVPVERAAKARDYLSHALGIALGRFPGDALPTGILFLAVAGPDNLAHARPLLDAWQAHGLPGDLSAFLRDKFFKEDHLSRYENRPIHWPLSSAKRNFVAWICIHRWAPNTLDTLRAEHVRPCLAALERNLADTPTLAPDKSRRGRDPSVELRDLVKELSDFDKEIERLSRFGPDPVHRAPFRMELEDGVRVNSAALYALLAPQWGQPDKWWREIASGEGRTAADWSKTAARYWPKRVDDACRKEPSHAVAHGCFWRYHPDRAWKWELRLQDEISPEFRIAESDADSSRAAFFADEPAAAIDRIIDEARRRRRGCTPEPYEFRYFETGLWEHKPLKMWKAETDLIKGLREDVWLRAPDEAVARAKLIAEHPVLVKDRAKLLRKVRKESDQASFSFAQPSVRRAEPATDTDGARPDDAE